MKTTLQVTVVNGLNNDGVGDIIRFVADHIEKIHGIIFQPVMFCGRDEDISVDERYAKRYPVSQIAYDLQAQTSFGGSRCTTGSRSLPTEHSRTCATSSIRMPRQEVYSTIYIPTMGCSPRFWSTLAQRRSCRSLGSSTWSSLCATSSRSLTLAEGRRLSNPWSFFP